MPIDPADWPEDFVHENGTCLGVCAKCNETFTGHKRRVLCKLCAQKPPDYEQWAKAQGKAKHD